MSSQAYIYNPTERTLAAAGDGFSCPRLTTAGRTALTLTTGDKGMMVYDTTLTTLCIWTGAAWEFIGDNSNLGFLSVKDFGATGNGTTDDTASILAAIAAATAAQCNLLVPAGTYKLTGATTLSIDIGKMSLVGDGTATFDCSTMTATNAINVFSSLAYPNSHYTNTVNKLSGIVFIGGSVVGRYGLLIGHPTNTNNGQTVIEGCSFVSFDRCHHFTDNAWRCTFRNCVFMTAVNYTMYWPAALTNAGESISYYHCQFNDGPGKLQVDADGVQINMYSCSILNQPVVINGISVTWSMFGGNMENPANPVPYTYLTITSVSTFYMSGTGLVLNAAVFTDAIFNLTNAGATLNLNNILFPDGANFQFETTVGWRTFSKGIGRVFLSGNSFQAASGGQKCPVSVTANSLNNGNFELGNINGWTAVTYGVGGSTATATLAAAKNGAFGLELTTVALGGINIYQQFAVKPGQLLQVFAWARVQTAGSVPSGYFQMTFLDTLGNAVSTTYSDPISNAAWGQFGSSQTRYVPAGASTCSILINAQVGGPNVIYVDDVIANVG